ncbi:MAG: hypothetical protein JW969_11340 [Spirochaetales bacterium]|nr:hypothetical protein [Spirochaetales bacterium]
MGISIGGINYGRYKLSTLPGANRIFLAGYSFTLLDLVPYPVFNVPVDLKSYVGVFLVDYLPVLME